MWNCVPWMSSKVLLVILSVLQGDNVSTTKSYFPWWNVINGFLSCALWTVDADPVLIYHFVNNQYCFLWQVSSTFQTSTHSGLGRGLDSMKLAARWTSQSHVIRASLHRWTSPSCALSSCFSLTYLMARWTSHFVSSKADIQSWTVTSLPNTFCMVSISSQFFSLW